MKFGRSYELQVAGNYGTNPGTFEPISISFPTTLELNITHNIFASANSCDLSIYGLSETNRGLIAFNQFLKAKAYPVTLYAGYISQVLGGLVGTPQSLPVVFNGFANVAYTERQGPELVTHINAFDNGDLLTGQPAAYMSGANAYTAAIGEPFAVTVKALVGKLTGGVKFGGVFVNPAQLPPNQTRPYTFNGNVWTNLRKLAASIKGGGGAVYITNNTCYVVGQDQTLPETSSLGTLSSDTGLLGIPRFTGPTIMVSCVFEPSLVVGGQINLLSKTNQNANGPCKIVAYTHHGIISGVRSGDLTSDITLMQLSATLGAIQS